MTLMPTVIYIILNVLINDIEEERLVYCSLMSIRDNVVNNKIV